MTLRTDTACSSRRRPRAALGVCEDFQSRLAQACQGRESYADHFRIDARLFRDGKTRIWWQDTLTGRGGPLGTALSQSEAQQVLPALFAQLREWRAGAKENKAECAAAGGQR
jgi:hypothetical protein